MSVELTYLEANSSPDTSEYFWAYRVTIENQGEETVQLRTRHWMITNTRGELTEVKGPGVIGEQPILQPGERTPPAALPFASPASFSSAARWMFSSRSRPSTSSRISSGQR